MRLLILFFALVAVPALAAQPVTLDQFGNGFFYPPAASPHKDFIVLLSPTSGMSDTVAAEATRLSDAGNAVLALDTKTYLASRVGTKDECLYPSGLIEDKVEELQKTLDENTFQRAIMVGMGDSGTLAAVTALQTLPGTYDAVIAPAFCPQFKAPVGFCLGDRLKRHKDIYQLRSVKSAAKAEDLYLANTGCPSTGTWPVKAAAADAGAFIDASLTADNGATVNGEIPQLADLPLAYLPSVKNDNDWLVVFISGDGGWRDIDRQIGTSLQHEGYAVIGVDSLRYFWSEKDPADVAGIVDRIIHQGLLQWHKKRVALVGYSFGADVMPHIVPLLSNRAAVKHIAVMGLGAEASFEITVGGFLGHGDKRYNTQAAFNAMPSVPTLCIYGSDEEKEGDAICPLIKQPWFTAVKVPGGHHFDEKYPMLTNMIVKQLR